MDFHEIWQENKSWILGVLAGVLVFFIADSVIRSYLGPSKKDLARAQSLARGYAAKKYRNSQASEARDDQAKVHATYSALRKSMQFMPDRQFTLQDQADPDLHYSKVNSAVRDELLSAASTSNFDLPESALIWSSPTNRQEIERRLLGLNVVQEAAKRLVAAHDRVTNADFEATGLRSIRELRIVERRRSSSTPRRRKEGEKLPEDYLQEQFVGFDFLADYATTIAFLESLRSGSKNLGLDSVEISLGKRPGDPLRCKGRLSARRILDTKEEQGS